MEKERSERVIEVSLHYLIDEIVYLKTDTDQHPRIITAITMRGKDYIVYELSRGEDCSWHVASELSLKENEYFRNKFLMQ